jgi:hypothetical protein
MRSPALLHALPAAALTQLVLRRTDSWQAGLNFNSRAFAQGLGRLTALRQLQLDCEDVGDACLAAIGQLTQLTKASLEITTVHGPTAKPCNLQLLPQQLQQLQLEAGSYKADATVLLALRYLTALQRLQLTLRCDPAPGSALPAGLTVLTVRVDREGANVQHLATQQLAQLQQLKAFACLHQPEQLQQLSSLPQLTHIELVHWTARDVLEAASAWRCVSRA